MSRIACLRIPRFQIAVHRKNEPGLKGRPFVVLDRQLTAGNTGRIRVLMCSPEASRHEIKPGMRLAEARAVCADAVWKEPDQALYVAAQAALVRSLIELSPRVTAERIGTILLDASGLRRLGGEKKFCRDVLALASRLGFTEARVGLADSAFASTVATLFKHRRWHIIAAGGDAAFLGPLSVRHLPVAPDIVDSLLALGVKTMGQLAQLPAASLLSRFGEAGLSACRLASGEDNRQPQIPLAEPDFSCRAEIGAPVSALNDTLFLLKSMLDRLMAALAHRGLRADELRLALFNDNNMFDTREIKLLRPSANTKFVLEVIKLSLTAQPLEREFTGLSLTISRFSPESWEQASIVPGQEGSSKTMPENLLLLLQRFAVRIGGNCLVLPVAADQYAVDDAGAWEALATPGHAVVPADCEYVRQKLGAGALVSGLVLRKLSAPAPLTVELDAGGPVAVNYDGRWQRIVSSTKEEKLSGLWWEKPFSKSYYTAALKPMGSKEQAAGSAIESLALIAHDHIKDSWLLEGFFD